MANLAIFVGSNELADTITKLIESSGHEVLGYPGTAGDGYYESIFADPEGNLMALNLNTIQHRNAPYLIQLMVLEFIVNSSSWQ